MERMSNEIANAFFIDNVSEENEQVIREMLNKAALEAMEWKEKQIIKKVNEFISNNFLININNHCVSKEDYYTLTELIRDLTKAMKGGK